MKFYCAWSSIENSSSNFMSVFFAYIDSQINMKNESERKLKYQYLTNKKRCTHPQDTDSSNIKKLIKKNTKRFFKF